MKAICVLEDGFSLQGEALGVTGERIGWVVFHTAVVGYQEMITDPANAGKILVLTYPLIGNYGCAPKFNESKKAWLAGLVIKEKSHIFSNWQARQSLDSFVKANNLLTLSEVDTRTLAVHLREKGEMRGIISTKNFKSDELLAKIKRLRNKTNPSLLAKISVNKATRFNQRGARYKIGVLDLGITQGILRQLHVLGFSLTLLPYNTTAQEILSHRLRGLIVSNGPEEDAGLKETTVNIRNLIGRLPLLGISTGHHVLARALGAKTKKMALGHRGVNYPICHPNSFKGEITVQNHAYVVEESSLQKIKDLAITAFNLNDHTVEEMKSKKLKLIGAQYLPVSPGFNEINPIFTQFMQMLRRS